MKFIEADSEENELLLNNIDINKIKDVKSNKSDSTE
jgi:hypothetical protein